MLGKKRKLKKISKTEPSFLFKLYQILSSQEYHSYIHWSHDGLSVIISDSIGLTKKVLPKYYNHHNYASFVRQLNMYNFHKIRTDPKSNEQKYSHNEFYRGKSVKEIQEIRRKIKNEDDKDKTGGKDKNNNLDKKLSINIKNNENFLDDKILLEEIENLEDDKKFAKYENLINSGGVSQISNDKILGFLLEKLKENESTQKNVENELNNLVQQNNNLLQQLQICNNKLASQKDFCKKMKGLVIFLVTLVMRKKQNYKICRVDINGNKNDTNDKKTTNLVDFVNKYLVYHNNKNKTNTNINININNKDALKDNNIINNININTINSTNNNINNKKPNNSIPSIQKGENFTIKQNDLYQNLNTVNNEDESYKDNDNSMNNSFSKYFNFDLDMKKGNNSISSINLFNSSINFTQKK